ncbi:transcriptional regulator family: Bromodomain transcription factor [Paecilomyces variotii]|nr:transcriptional regulator family: Bromodomain transcription factor [Paecilomyces variotii]KAJ9315673.1 transcriptional regulator family: Bromodomain transcription factor [Paecilomyces variotii]
MPSEEPAIKRSSSSAPGDSDQAVSKRIKRHYHHHHRLQYPVAPELPEPAITDEVSVDHLLNRSIGQVLREVGFDLADPVALDGFRNAAEEYILRFAAYVRQSMLSSRRLQPIPPDFEHALRQSFVSVDDLSPYLKSLPAVEPVRTLLPSPPPEEDAFTALPSLGPALSGEEDRVRSAYIPKHFPEFPSKHTYRHTPVFTDREHDPRKIRERATEDGRLGEEALRKLARAAFKDNQLAAASRDKKLWGRKNENLETMFEKTIKGLAKKAQRSAADAAPSMDITSGEQKPPRPKLPIHFELGPIVNCERDFWRKTASATGRKAEKKQTDQNDAVMATVEG